MRLKIVSNGTSFGTRFINMDTNEPLARVKECIITINADGKCEAELTLMDIPVEIEDIIVARFNDERKLNGSSDNTE